jgi:hypothetical protein
MRIVASVADVLAMLLATDAQAAADEVGLIKRRRKVTGPLLAQTWILGWLSKPSESLSGLVCMAATVGLLISAQGLAKRETERGAAFLKRLLEKATQYAVCADPAVRPVLERFTVVQILDSSVIRLPDVLKEVWLGCQGAALKVSAIWDLRTGRLGLALRPGREQDRSSPAQVEPVAKGGLRLADLGYYTVAVLNALASQGAYFLSRVPASTVVQGPDGTTCKVADLLKQSHETTVDLPVRLGAHKTLSCRLIAVPVPASVADERRKRLRDEARRRQKPLSAAALFLAGWTVMVTNVPANMLTVVEALALMRVRWQIELLFKLWKSECLIDVWRSGNRWAVLCELYAKLIAVVINNWLLLMTVWDRPNPSLTIATRTIRKFVIVLAHALASGRRRRLVDALQLMQRSLSASVRVQSRRSSPSTHQRLAAACGPP